MSQKKQNNGNGRPPVGEQREPEQEPNTHPRSGQPRDDVQDGKIKSKHGNRAQGTDRINPEDEPPDDKGENNDEEPVEERSPRIPRAL